MPDLGKYLTELPEALTLDDDDILYTVVGSGTTTSKKVKKSTILSADRTARATAEGTIVANFAAPYDSTASYAVGDYCIKDLVLYKCTSPTSGTWDSSKWTQVTALDLTSGVASDLADEIEARQSADETLQGEIDELPIDVQVDGGTLVNEDNIAVLDSLVAYGEASGEIATFSDGSDLAMKSLKVAITPQQDLHGYDAPWVGGAGKNKLNYDEFKKTTFVKSTGVWENNGVTITATENDAYTNTAQFPVNARIAVNEGETITLSWESTDLIHGLVYIFPNGGATGLVSADNYNAKEVSYTVGSGITYITYRFGVSNSGETIHYKNIMARKSGNATFSPYSNICPISGWDECKPTVCSKNLFDKVNCGVYNGYIAGTQVYGSPNHRTIYIPCKPNTTYSSANFSGNSRKALTYSSKVPSAGLVVPTPLDTITTDANAKYLLCYCYNSNSDTVTFDDVKNALDIELGSVVPTSYHAYNGHTYTIDLGSTRYGGNLDVVSGVLTVDRVGVDLGSLTWNGSLSAYHYYTTLSIPYKWANNTQFICSKYKFDGRGTGGNYYGVSGTFRYWYSEGGTQAYEIYVCDETHTFSSFTEVKEYLSGTTLVYELATPQVVQLTATEIRTLLGINNIWCDTGDVDVLYPRDLNIVINNILSRLNVLEG